MVVFVVDDITLGVIDSYNVVVNYYVVYHTSSKLRG